MRIIATSDLHGSLPPIEPCDLLILGGDLCPDYMYYRRVGNDIGLDLGQEQQAEWLNTVFREWLEDIPAEHIVGIAGNHDYIFEDHRLIPDLPWIYLRDAEVEVLDLKLYGTPWVPNLPGWAFYADENKLRDKYGLIPHDLDILISHGPPYGFSDRISYTHVGSPELLDAIRIKQPRVVVCGHIHEGYGLYNLQNDGVSVDIYNVALKNRHYVPTNPPVEINLDGE